MLAGSSIREKSEFFAGLGTSTAAYWRNHNAISRWCTFLQSKIDGSNTDPFMRTYIGMMTDLEPSSRPTAKDLVVSISTARFREAGYTRSCCFDDLHSDSTSWQGSDIGGDEIFETANTTSDMTTASSFDASARHQNISVPSTFGIEARPVERFHSRLLSNSTVKDIPLKGASGKEPPEIVCNDAGVGRDHKANKPEIDLNPQETNPSSGHGPISSSGEHSNQLKPGPNAKIKILEVTTSERDMIMMEAFHASHERLEMFLLEVKKEDPSWQSRLTPLIKQGHTDCKGFNILIMACKFGNLLLANEIIDQVVEHNVTLIRGATVFGNTGLHYAASNGKMNIIARLVEHGADQGARNVYGRTALRIAIQEQQFDSAKILITTMSSKDIDDVDNAGFTALHAACSFPVSAELVRSLLEGGCEATRRAGNGYTPLQMSRGAKNTMAVQLILSYMPANTSDLAEKPVSYQRDDIWKPYTDLDKEHCKCNWCLFNHALEALDENFPRQYLRCPCPNHVTVITKDALYHMFSMFRCLEKCLCKACMKAQEYNQTHSPCGTPIGKHYLPCNDSLISSKRTDAPSTQDPISTLELRHGNIAISPYPGHHYYDHLIEEKMKTTSSNLSQEEMTIMVLNCLADAGFMKEKSYRKHPDDAMRWIIDHYDEAIYVTRMVEILLNCGADVNTSTNARGLLAVAAEKGDIALIRLLLHKGALADPEVPIANPDLPNSFDALRKRLKNRKERLGSTDVEHNPLRAALRNKHILACRLLLQGGANVNRADTKHRNKTPLHVAVDHCDALSEYISLLLAHGASLEVKTSAGSTPLALAVQNRRLNVARILLESGADANASYNQAGCLIGTAIRDHFYTIPRSDRSKSKATMAYLLLSYGARVRPSDHSSPYALNISLSSNEPAIAEFLLDEYYMPGEIYSLDSRGRGYLHYLALTEDKKAGPLMDRLLQLAQDLNVQDNQGETPLHWAVRHHNLMFAKKLVDRKAIVGVVNKHDATPMDIARSRNVSALIEILGGSITNKKRWWK